ncbi:hypothetical protein [Streptomyces sp. Wb2n-11]|uniref:hypothetical protein n=1 Tax=Streptomyces sp. Wb2n-11 TaxID=1030533 RepID=UPI00159EC94C|nr:hypothetical protein [Streptomyces sp. Wb2n-11]
MVATSFATSVPDIVCDAYGGLSVAEASRQARRDRSSPTAPRGPLAGAAVADGGM